MKNHARVVVIGGGVVGCSILYHLAKAGWADCVLIERQELTSGSSWHAAGSLFAVTRPNTVAILQKYTFDLLPRLEAESGQPIGFHLTGGLNLCRSPEELQAQLALRSAVRRVGIEYERISFQEARALAPILETKPLHAVMLERLAGHVDPASLTQAFAAAARKLGATVVRHNPVIETTPLPNGHWQVVTRNGTIEAEKLVNAAGLWGREVAALAGITLPLMPVEHHYLVTQAIAAIEAHGRHLPEINDNESNVYARQEGMGLLVGAYESRCTHWAEDGTPADFGHELLPDDLSRMDWNFSRAVEVMPCLATAGVKRVICGPMIFSPDLSPLIGPYPGLRNYFCANGVMTGFNQGAGVGRVLSEWIIEGEPSLDIFAWDVARFGAWASPTYTKATTAWYYENRSARFYPNQEIEAGRPVLKSPVHERYAAANAVFGFSYGLEHPLYIAHAPGAPQNDLTFGKPHWFDSVLDECRRVREAAGLFDFTFMGKFLVEGRNARPWLERVMAGRIPGRAGRMALVPMLSAQGHLIGDFTVSRIGAERFLLLATDSMQQVFMRHFSTFLPADGVVVRNISADLGGLHLAGPAAQTILAAVSDGDVSTPAFPFMHARTLTAGGIADVIALRVSFTGETGYELYCPRDRLAMLHDALMAAGKAHGLAPVGTRALMMTRLEKSYPSWGRELTADYTPYEAGLQRFLDLGRGDFVGYAATLRDRQRGPRECRVTLTVAAPAGTLWGEEAIFRDGAVVGYVTSGGTGVASGMTIALGYIRAEALSDTAGYAVEALGRRYPALLQRQPLYDPAGLRMRV